MNKTLALTLMIAALALAACAAPAAGSGPALDDDPVIEVAGCPEAAAGQQLIGSPELGFCTLALESFSLESYGENSYSVEGPLPTAGIAPRVLIEISEAPADLAEYVDGYVEERLLPDMEARIVEHPVGGESGLMVDGLPGQDFTRHVFVVRGETLYHFTFLPWETEAENFEQVFTSYELIIGSLAWQ